MIPETLVAEVFARTDILDVISEYVRLEKKGRHHLGLCPFHQEKTPSFTVTPERQMFYCFGCGVGGNVFKFLMLKENLTFPESVRFLAKRAGVHIPEVTSPRDEKLERFFQVNEWARDYFRQQLESREQGAPARDYLARRGITPEIRDEFQLGFAPPRWDALVNYLTRKGCRAEDLVVLGLVNRGERGTYYDRFRNRIIFPVWNASGRVIGFGGRVLDDSQPKYLNSPETPVFHKGQVLYALHLARQAIRNEGCVVIVEGYLDAITAHQYGIRNTVASLGTSLTQDQGRLLMRYTMDALIAYDADAAGVAATIRSLDLLQELGCRVRVVSVPEGQDPDGFLREAGVTGWRQLVAGATPLLEYKLARIAARTGTATAAERLAALREVIPNLHALSSEVEREEGFQIAARTLGVTWETIRGEYRRFTSHTKGNWAKTDKIAKKLHNIVTKPSQAREKAETGILRIVLHNPSLLETVKQELGDAFFKNGRHQRIFETYLRYYNQPGFAPALLANYLEETEQEIFNALMGRELDAKDQQSELKAYIEAIKRLNIREKRRELLDDLAAAERAGDRERVNRLMQEIQEVSKTP
jgi:DNA primase